MSSFFKFMSGFFTTIFTKSTLSAREDFKAVSSQQNKVMEMLIIDSKECKEDRKNLNQKIDLIQNQMESLRNEIIDNKLKSVKK